MFPLTRFVVVALSCAALEGAHACLYLDPPNSLAYPSEPVVPLVRREPPDPRIPKACERKCSHLHPDEANEAIIRISCTDDCTLHPHKYDLAAYLLAVQITHPDDIHAHTPAPYVASPGRGVSPTPPPSAAELDAEFLAWCRERVRSRTFKTTVASCLNTKRKDWETERRCRGPPLPSDPNEHLKEVYPEFVDWCIKCSVMGSQVRSKTALEYISNPGLVAVWKREVKDQALSPKVPVKFVTWCMLCCLISKQGIPSCVKASLASRLSEWKEGTPVKSFNDAVENRHRLKMARKNHPRKFLRKAGGGGR